MSAVSPERVRKPVFPASVRSRLASATTCSPNSFRSFALRTTASSPEPALPAAREASRET